MVSEVVVSEYLVKIISFPIHEPWGYIVEKTCLQSSQDLLQSPTLYTDP